jgi:hypothetical protein
LRLGREHPAQAAAVLGSRPPALANKNRLAVPSGQRDGVDFNRLWLICPERTDRDDAFARLAGFGEPPKMRPKRLFVPPSESIVQVGDEDRETDLPSPRSISARYRSTIPSQKARRLSAIR